MIIDFKNKIKLTRNFKFFFEQLTTKMNKTLNWLIYNLFFFLLQLLIDKHRKFFFSSFLFLYMMQDRFLFLKFNIIKNFILRNGERKQKY